MKTTIKCDFKELSKSVVAEAKIELEIEDSSIENIKLYKEKVLEESKEMMNQAMAYSKSKSLEK